jgi:hypothetical protein
MAAVMPSVRAIGNREQGGDTSQLQSVDEASGDEVSDRHVIGIGRSEIACDEPCEPPHEPDNRRLVQMHGRAKARDGLWCCGLAKQDRCRVAGEHHRGEEYREGDDYQRNCGDEKSA